MAENKTTITQGGFTTVELLVTLMVAGIVITSFYQLFVLSQKMNGAARHKAVASTIAYSNLRQFHSINYPTWFVCDATSEMTDVSPNPSGQVLLEEARTDTSLPPPVTVEVRAFAPHGCGTDKVVKVISLTRYGNPVKEVMHATYIGH